MNFNELKGHTIHRIEGAEQGSEQIAMLLTGILVVMMHRPDCCESVQVNEIHGDVNDLIESEILHAEEVVNPPDAPDLNTYDSHTWTFYHLRTTKGSVTFRWLGESNGYYSESVSLEMQQLELDQYVRMLEGARLQL